MRAGKGKEANVSRVRLDGREVQRGWDSAGEAQSRKVGGSRGDFRVKHRRE